VAPNVKTVAFCAGQLDLGGTSVANFDYADANETILGNRSVVLFDELAANDPRVVERFRRRFRLADCRGRDRCGGPAAKVNSARSVKLRGRPAKPAE